MRLRVSQKTLRLVIAGLFVLLVFYFFYTVRGILLPFLLALILAYLLNPLVNYLESFKIPRVPAVLLLYFSVFTLGYFFIVYGFPVIVRELNRLAETFPQIIGEFQTYFNAYHARFRDIEAPMGLNRGIESRLNDLQLIVINQFERLAAFLMNIFSRLISIVLAPVLAFYLLKDWAGFGRRLLLVLPLAVREDAAALWQEIDRVLMGFFRGHLVVAALVGILTAVGLSLVGMNYAVLLGVISGLTDLIPYFGPFIGAVPALVLALFQSNVLALKVLIVMVVVQQVESNLISPAILGDSVGLHPLAVIFALLAGGHLFGIIGLLLAVPTAGVLRVIASYFYTRLVT